MMSVIAHPYGDLVHFTRSRKEWEAAVREDGGDEVAGPDALGITWLGTSGYIVGVFSRDPGTMAHEMSHVALSILDRVGIDVQEANQEPFCYLLGYLVRHFTKAKA